MINITKNRIFWVTSTLIVVILGGVIAVLISRVSNSEKGQNTENNNSIIDNINNSSQNIQNQLGVSNPVSFISQDSTLNAGTVDFINSSTPYVISNAEEYSVLDIPTGYAPKALIDSIPNLNNAKLEHFGNQFLVFNKSNKKYSLAPHKTNGIFKFSDFWILDIEGILYSTPLDSDFTTGKLTMLNNIESSSENSLIPSDSNIVKIAQDKTNKNRLYYLMHRDGIIPSFYISVIDIKDSNTFENVYFQDLSSLIDQIQTNDTEIQKQITLNNLGNLDNEIERTPPVITMSIEVTKSKLLLKSNNYSQNIWMADLDQIQKNSENPNSDLIFQKIFDNGKIDEFTVLACQESAEICWVYSLTNNNLYQLDLSKTSDFSSTVKSKLSKPLNNSDVELSQELIGFDESKLFKFDNTKKSLGLWLGDKWVEIYKL